MFDSSSNAANDVPRAAVAAVFEHVVEYRTPDRNDFLVVTDAEHSQAVARVILWLSRAPGHGDQSHPGA